MKTMTSCLLQMRLNLDSSYVKSSNLECEAVVVVDLFDAVAVVVDDI